MKTPYTTTTIVASVARKLDGYYKQDVKTIVDAFLDEVVDLLVKGEDVYIRKIGRFQRKIRTPRDYKSPIYPERLIQHPGTYRLSLKPTAKVKRDLHAAFKKHFLSMKDCENDQR